MSAYLSIDRVLKRSLFVFKKHLGRFAALSGVLIATLLVIGGLIGGLVAVGAGAGSGIIFMLVVIGTLLAAAAMAAMFTFTASVVKVVEAEERGFALPSIVDVAKSVTNRILPLFYVGLVVAIATFLGYLFFIIPGIYLLVIWCVVTPVIVIEGVSMDALGRSKALIKGNGWGVFGFGLVLYTLIFVFMLALIAITLIIALIIGAGFGSTAGGTISTVLQVAIYVCLLPVAGIIQTVLYFELAGLDGHAAVAQAPTVNAPTSPVSPPPPPAPPAVPQV
ncbi:MAG: hypothetical protein NTX07_04035 [Solirubrobacterales bacterium]|nr:hypothetical protein [Solirubrobacterales bacterium]